MCVPICCVLYTMDGFPSLVAAVAHKLHTACQLQNAIISVRVQVYTVATEIYNHLRIQYVHRQRSRQIGITLCVCKGVNDVSRVRACVLWMIKCYHFGSHRVHLQRSRRTKTRKHMGRFNIIFNLFGARAEPTGKHAPLGAALPTT